MSLPVCFGKKMGYDLFDIQTMRFVYFELLITASPSVYLTPGMIFFSKRHRHH